jgi:NitT/TauT family transport system ATP-binding protein
VRGEVPDGVGVVFQEDASFPWLTVEDNVGFGLAPRRASMRRKAIEGSISR